MCSKLSEFSYLMLNISSIINTSFGMVSDRMFLLLFLFLQKFSFCSLQAWWKMLMKYVYPISSFIQILYLCKFKVWGRFSLIIIYYTYGKLYYIFFWNFHVFLPDKFYSYRQKKSLLHWKISLLFIPSYLVFYHEESGLVGINQG